MKHDRRALLLTGPPGSGKSTVARLLMSRFQRAVHLRSDEFFHFIRAGYVEPWKPESHEQNKSSCQSSRTPQQRTPAPDTSRSSTGSSPPDGSTNRWLRTSEAVASM